MESKLYMYITNKFLKHLNLKRKTLNCTILSREELLDKNCKTKPSYCNLFCDWSSYVSLRVSSQLIWSTSESRKDKSEIILQPNWIVRCLLTTGQTCFEISSTLLYVDVSVIICYFPLNRKSFCGKFATLKLKWSSQPDNQCNQLYPFQHFIHFVFAKAYNKKGPTLNKIVFNLTPLYSLEWHVLLPETATFARQYRQRFEFVERLLSLFNESP